GDGDTSVTDVFKHGISMRCLCRNASVPSRSSLKCGRRVMSISAPRPRKSMPEMPQATAVSTMRGSSHAGQDNVDTVIFMPHDAIRVRGKCNGRATDNIAVAVILEA